MMKFPLSLLFAILTHFLFCQISFAPIGPSGGGAMYSPSINPHNGNMFLICDMGELFTSPEGQNWQLIPSDELIPGLRSEVEFTSDPNILYSIHDNVLTEANYAVKSTDGGTSWQALADDPTSENCTNLFVNSNSTNHIIIADAEELYLSTDGGNNFTSVYQVSAGNTPFYVAGCFWDGNQVYIGTRQGLLVSNNGGSSFVLDNTAGMPTNKGFFEFTGSKSGGITRLYGIVVNKSSIIDPYSDDVDISGNNTIIQCDFGSTNWQQSFSSPNIKFYRITSSPNNINIAYASADFEGAEGRIFKTSNGGNSWSNVLLTNGNQNITTAWAGEGSEFGWAWSAYAHGLTVDANDPNHIIATDWGFALRSTDGGAHWQQMYAGQGAQNMECNDEDESLAYINNGLNVTTTWDVNWMSSNDIFGSYTDITGWRTNDGGDSWKNNDLNNIYNTTYKTINHPTNNTVYAAASDVHDMYTRNWLTDDDIESGPGAILFSNNNASSWSVLHDFGLPVVDIIMDPNNVEIMYAAVVHSQNGGIYKTTNLSAGTGATWIRLLSPPRTEGHPYKINILNDGSLVVSYSGRLVNDEFTQSSGVFYSENGGVTWTDRSGSQLFYWTKDVIIDPNDVSQNTWYACVQDGNTNNTSGKNGVFRSIDRGVSWTKILANVNAESVAIHPLDEDEIYVSTEFQGLWHANNLSASQPSFARLEAYPFFHPMRIQFNPYDANDIWISSFGAGLMRGATNIILAVEYLEEFGAKIRNHQVTLSWSTSNEENSDYFEIERSLNTQEWETKGVVQAKNTTHEVSFYSVIDRIPLKGVSYYRLKQFDKDGVHHYSKIIQINNKIELQINIFPNPTQGNIEFRALNYLNEGIIIVRDATGRKLIQQNIKGKLSNLDLSIFPNGMYWISVYAQGETLITKVILQK